MGFDDPWWGRHDNPFDRQSPDGSLMMAQGLARGTVTNLHGEFATVASTRPLLGMLAEAP